MWICENLIHRAAVFDIGLFDLDILFLFQVYILKLIMMPSIILNKYGIIAIT